MRFATCFVVSRIVFLQGVAFLRQYVPSPLHSLFEECLTLSREQPERQRRGHHVFGPSGCAGRTLSPFEAGRMTQTCIESTTPAHPRNWTKTISLRINTWIEDTRGRRVTEEYCCQGGETMVCVSRHDPVLNRRIRTAQIID